MGSKLFTSLPPFGFLGLSADVIYDKKDDPNAHHH